MWMRWVALQGLRLRQARCTRHTGAECGIDALHGDSNAGVEQFDGASPVALNRATERYNGTISVKNTEKAALPGPVYGWGHAGYYDFFQRERRYQRDCGGGGDGGSDWNASGRQSGDAERCGRGELFGPGRDELGQRVSLRSDV